MYAMTFQDGTLFKKLYEEKVGVPDLIELVKGSSDVDTAAFLPQKVLLV